MLGLVGIIKENLKQQGIILAKFFDKRNRIVNIEGENWIGSVLTPSRSESDSQYFLFEEPLRPDYNKNSWEFTVKMTRSKLDTSAGLTFTSVIANSTDSSDNYKIVTSLIDSGKVIQSWWGNEYSTDREIKIRNSSTGIYWLRVSYDKNSGLIESFYSLNGTAFNKIVSMPRSNFKQNLRFEIQMYALYTEVKKEDITFKYGDEILFGS